jgi:hypothetical protein
MTVKDLLATCEALSVTLAPGDHGALRVRPPGILPEDLKHLLKAHKVAILNLLAGPPLYDCYTCQRRHYWQHAETYKWICATCHPPPHPEVIESLHEASEPARSWLGGTGCMDRRHLGRGYYHEGPPRDPPD